MSSSNPGVGAVSGHWTCGVGECDQCRKRVRGRVSPWKPGFAF